MSIELISIGDELLKGVTVNTNAAFICKELQSNGYEVVRQTTIPDDPDVMMSAFQEALNRSKIVVTTGGLGPTLDDKTRYVAASLFSSEFRFDESIAEDLKRRFGPESPSISDQATVPVKASILKNPVGTAPGLIFSEKGNTLILLPGVPAEMKELLTSEVLPYLQKQFPISQKKESIQLFFSILPESRIDPLLRELKERYPEVEVGIYPSWGTLSVILRSLDREALHRFKNDLCSRFDAYLFPSQTGKIEEAIHTWFIQNKMTLALAESCTGGMIASHLTALPGASLYFLGGFVAYSNQFKMQLLEVSDKTLQDQTAVSKEAVTEMCAGIFKHTQADFAIAVSGIAGPVGGTPSCPVGTIWAAIGKRGEPYDVGTFMAKGNRETILLSTTNILLGALYRKVTKGIAAFPLILEGN